MFLIEKAPNSKKKETKSSKKTSHTAQTPEPKPNEITKETKNPQKKSPTEPSAMHGVGGASDEPHKRPLPTPVTEHQGIETARDALVDTSGKVVERESESHKMEVASPSTPPSGREVADESRQQQWLNAPDDSTGNNFMM